MPVRGQSLAVTLQPLSGGIAVLSTGSLYLPMGGDRGRGRVVVRVYCAVTAPHDSITPRAFAQKRAGR